MEKPTLESARLKLRRAKVHLEELRAIYDSIPVDVTWKTELSDEVDFIGKKWTVLRCTDMWGQPPAEWGLIVGDAMHNARSALDHLACRLVELDGGLVTTRTAFPIWDDDPNDSADTRNRYDRLVEGMSGPHQDAVSALQPYRNAGSPGARLLLALATIDNKDKHQIVVPSVATLPEAPLDLLTYATSDKGGVPFEMQWNGGAAIAPGVEFVRFHVPTGDHIAVNLVTDVRPTYGDPTMALAELCEVHAYCVGIVESFAPEFD